MWIEPDVQTAHRSRKTKGTGDKWDRRSTAQSKKGSTTRYRKDDLPIPEKVTRPQNRDVVKTLTGKHI